MTTTIQDIAKKCGVGVSTVSRAINNHPDINPETKTRILEMVKKYHYVPNNSARNLKRTESKTIAILVKGISNPLFTKMLQVLEKEITRKKYAFFLQHVDEKQDEIEVAFTLIKEKRLSGIVFLGGLYEHSSERLQKMTVPFVLCTVGLVEEIEDVLCSYFAIDDKKESRKITEYLIEEGHKKIAILAAFEEDCSIGKLRLEGYKEALKANGIKVDDSLIRYMREDVQSYSMRNGYEVMKELLEEKAGEFTAVYAISDMQAIGASRAIVESGKQIPNDYSVAGFDGLPAGFYYNPPITTIKQPGEAIATESISALFKMIKTKERVKGKVFEGELLQRESTREI
jgi:LacI family transcriptional regulator